MEWYIISGQVAMLTDTDVPRESDFTNPGTRVWLVHVWFKNTAISYCNALAINYICFVVIQVLWRECYLCKVDMKEGSNTISATLAAMEQLVGKNETLQGKVEALQK